MRRLTPALLLCLLLCLPALAQVPPPSPAPRPDFKALDANGDGRLSLEEVMAYATKKSAEVRPFSVREVDRDGDGRLTPEELLGAGLLGLERFGVIDARELDVNGDGYVSREELDAFFKKRHGQEFARVDADKNGDLRPSEFVLFRF